MKKKMLSAAFAASLVLLSPALFSAGEAQCAPVAARPVEGLAPSGMVFYQHSGMRLFIPQEYDGLLLTQTPRKSGDGRLFTVSEKASIEAATAMGAASDGAGWLFDIAWVDEAGYKKMICEDMTGVEIFARDHLGNRYIFRHPTDVRYYRKDVETMRRDQAQWSKLCEWAGKSVRENFILDNLDLGLTAETCDNSEVSIYLARAAYRPGAVYTVSSNEYGPLASAGVAAAPYVDRLIRNVSYHMVDIGETPDGEYVALQFPEDGVRFDFFKMAGKENYVRAVRADGSKLLYKATFADGTTKASEVMRRWYWSLSTRR
ncbi:MAG: hypothetical protein IJU05_00870 [Schwartzia sp.]|nr:hypothetical protein [Schwartzia sp. (in: firmicutes)]